MPTQQKRSVLQRMKDRAKDLDVALSYQSRGEASPPIGRAEAPRPRSATPARGSGGGRTTPKPKPAPKPSRGGPLKKRKY